MRWHLVVKGVNALVIFLAAVAALVVLAITLMDRNEPVRTIPATYHVVNLSKGARLNVREGPGTRRAVICTVPESMHRIVRLNGIDVIAGREWWQVQLPDGTIGWVSSRYLAPD